MSTYTKIRGASLATAVALVFIASPAIPAFADDDIHALVICPGVNSCQGRSDCRMTTSSCRVLSEKGTNTCKGQGFLVLSKVECVKKGAKGLVYTDPPSAVRWE
jgi:hypothetical protein